MLHLPLDHNLKRALFKTLTRTHTMSCRVHIRRGGDEKRVGSFDFRRGGSRIISGSVTVDTTQDISRSLDLTFVDVRHRMIFDPDSPTEAASWAEWVMDVEYLVYVPHHNRHPRSDEFPGPTMFPGETKLRDTGQWVAIPVFYGPITQYDSTGPEVTITAMGKENRGLSPHLVTKGYTLKKHMRVDDAIEFVLGKVNETRFAMCELPWHLGEDRAIGAAAEPWRIVIGGDDVNGHHVKGLISRTGKHPHHAYYDGRGDLRIKRLNKEPVHTFTYGDIISEPDWSYDDEQIINTVVVRGKKVKSKGKDKDKSSHITATVTLPREHGLSPWKLGTPGEPIYYTRFVDVPSLSTEHACQQRGRHLLEHHVSKSVAISVDVFPVPMLEELDRVRVKVDGFTHEFPLEQWTLPLTSDTPMNIGNTKRIGTKSGKRSHGAGAAGPGGKGATGGTGGKGGQGGKGKRTKPKPGKKQGQGYLIGKVVDVQEKLLYTELSAAASPADAFHGHLLYLEDVTKVAQEGGNAALRVFGQDDEVVAYTVVGYEDDSADELDSDEPDVSEDPAPVVLPTPISIPYDADTRFVPLPEQYVKQVSVQVEDQDDVVIAQLEQGIYDQLVDGPRTDASAETVHLELRDDEWTVVDVLGQQGPGLERGYDANSAVVNVSGGLGTFFTLCEVPIVIPTTQHRILVWYSANLSGPNDGTEINLYFDDNDFDFPVANIPLVTWTVDSGTAYDVPTVVMPVIPRISIPAGTTATWAGSHIVGSLATDVLPTSFMPYTVNQPTPGLHTFRLIADQGATAGDAFVATSKLWVTVV